MGNPVLIRTNRLVLRTVTMEDANAVALSWKLDEGPISPQEAKDKITWMIRNHEQIASGRLVHLCLAIIHKGTQEFIGWCGLDHLDQRKINPVLFYLLKVRYWGRGLATEAAKAVIDYAFSELNLARIDSATTNVGVGGRGA